MTVREMLARWLRILFTGSAFLLFFLYGALLSYVILPIARAVHGGDEEKKARRCRMIVGASWVFFHAYMRILGLLSYTPKEARLGLSLPPPPFVLVANHPTLVDVTAICATYCDLAIVAKRALFASPLVGRLLRYCGHIDGGDGNVFSGIVVVEQALERLRRGVSVLIFPEGTRSPERGLGPFHLGAFQIAARARVPIVTMVVTCEPPMLMRGQAWCDVPSRGAKMTIRQLPSRDVTPSQVHACSRELHVACLAALGLVRGQQSAAFPPSPAPERETGVSNG